MPLLSTEQKPEVLRFAAGTDADLRLTWQEFLIRMIANAFSLPPMLLGLEQDVNRSTARNRCWTRRSTAPSCRWRKLVAEHLTRDLFAKRLGWPEFEFVFNDLDASDEMQEVQMQTALLEAGVLTVNEVRAMRGLAPMVPDNRGRERPGDGGGRGGECRNDKEENVTTVDYQSGNSGMTGEDMKLEAMAVTLPEVAGHPNRAPVHGRADAWWMSRARNRRRERADIA